MPDVSPTLAEALTTPEHRPQVIAECVDLVDDEVRSKSGLGGVAIKGAYVTVKKIKPKFIPEVIDGLLDEWIAKMEPYYATWREGGQGAFADFITARSEDVAEDLLTVTDDKAQTTSHKTVRRAYAKMRPSAKRNVALAIPKLGRLVERHTGNTV
ncbi:MAG TPA: hypothetical protein VFG83_07025 [Kofleriaceae bacterium]|nr:hypothetical protein [Kofleriaceae bacterium]